MTLRKLAGVMAAFLLLVAGGARAQNLIVNGNFETGWWDGWNWGGAWWMDSPGYEGNWAIMLSTDPGTGPYTLSQDIVTVPGQVYLASAWFKNVVDTLPRDNVLEVYWNSDLIGAWYNEGTFDWEYGWTYVVGTGNDTLTFSGHNSSGAWWVDDVRLEPSAIPELPTLVPLAFFSLSALGLARHRRRT